MTKIVENSYSKKPQTGDENKSSYAEAIKDYQVSIEKTLYRLTENTYTFVLPSQKRNIQVQSICIRETSTLQIEAIHKTN